MNYDILLNRWSSMSSTQVSTSNIVTPAQSSSRRINGAPPTSEKKRDRDRRIWEKFGNDADRKRAKVGSF